MTVHVKRAGVWTQADEAWVKGDTRWNKLDSVWTKYNGVWQAAIVPPNAVPSAPILSLEVIANRYISVGMRYPGLFNEPSVRIMQVNVARDPDTITSQYGSGQIAGNADGYPDENWSLWHYVEPSFVGGQVHGDTTVTDHKAYPLNAQNDPTIQLPQQQHYYFAAWTKNDRGAWSNGIFQQIFMPLATSPVTGVMVKNATFQPYNAGTLINSTFDESFVSPKAAANDLAVQSSGTTSAGAWFYGNQVTNAVGDDGPPTVTAARIFISRDADESPAATANVNIFWHAVATPGYLDGSQRLNRTKVGVLAKGQQGWFDLPASFLPHLNVDLKGIGVDWDRPNVTSSDSARFLGPQRAYRSGNLIVEWTEQT